MRNLLLLLTSLIATLALHAGKFESLNKKINTISFKENKGQIHDQYNKTRPDVLFTGNSGELFFYLRNDGISYQLNRVDSWKKEFIQTFNKAIDVPENTTIYRIDMNWLNVSKASVIEAEGMNANYDTYYTTNCPSKGVKAMSYNNIYYREIYSNISLHYYNKSGELKYDYIVAPGGNYKNIQIEIKGAQSLEINKQGGLIIKTPLGYIEEGAPLVYQNGAKLTSRWKLTGNIISFEIDNYDSKSVMIIDPLTRLWGTFSGGIGDDTLLGSAEGSSSDVYFCGRTKSTTNIATTGAYQATLGGSYDACILKFNSSGAKIWGTYIGDGNDEIATCIAIHPSGDIVITGNACGTATNISTVGSHQPILGGNCDAILMRFSPAGAIVWGTYYGGPATDAGNYCCVDANGDIYLTGRTASGTGTIIATTGSHQSSIVGTSVAFLAKFSGAGVRQWGTYYGGGNGDVANQCTTDSQNNVVLCGITVTTNSTLISTTGALQQNYGGGSDDGFIVKFNSSGVRQWGTYFGDAGSDHIYTCKLNATDAIYFAGATTSSANISTTGAFQTSNNGGVNDGYLAKLNPSGSTLLWCTYYGGGNADPGYCTLDAQGYPYLVGWTGSASSISTPQSFQPIFGGIYDVFIAKFTSNGTRLWGTYFGGGGQEFNAPLTVGSGNNLYLCGTTSSTGTTIATSAAFQTSYGGSFDGFIEKFNDCTPFDPTNQTTSSITCEGSSFSVSASSGTSTVTWFSSLSSTNSVGNGTAISTSTLGIGTYTFYAEASISTCSLTSQRTPVVLQILQSPTLSALSSETNIICIGQTATLTAFGANVYTWTPGGPGSSIVVSPTITTTYSVIGTNTVGCSNSVSITQSVSICAGINFHENLISLDTKLYPNPSSNGIITIETKSGSILKMYNSLGQMVLTLKMNEIINHLDLSSLSKGIYFICIEPKSGNNSVNKKLLIE